MRCIEATFLVLSMRLSSPPDSESRRATGQSFRGRPHRICRCSTQSARAPSLEPYPYQGPAQSLELVTPGASTPSLSRVALNHEPRRALRVDVCELGPLNFGTDLEDGPLSSPVITEY